MPKLLEIKSEDITQLNDTDLRTLIGLLCEADYRLAGLSTKGITWGGHQDAKDGGLDVIIRGDIDPPSNSFVPKRTTGFQVKKPDMSRTQILKEMKPKGFLREEIKSIIHDYGAYIIVSSGSSTTNTALKSRIKAMREAIENEPNNKNLQIEFMDSGRVATWVRSHPSMILWVRNKINRNLKGWRPYENWAKAPGDIEEEYLMDDGLRLHDETKSTFNDLPISDGISKLRSALLATGTCVRLIGLSGVGKTRLVQALFDERIGETALNCNQAFYTDISDSPEPDPKSFAEQIIAEKKRAILIIDNCPPDLHKRLTATCAGVNSTVSLLTVEYDIRDDLPDETSVYRLEPNSEVIIEKLINKRFPHISRVDSQTIANFSGGNARIAITLANTVLKGDTLSGFRDEELFKRLFMQRNNADESLLTSAEIFSLVYSFEGTDVNSDKSEIKLLATFLGKTGQDLYRDIVKLKDRGLIQMRGVWRAVLPQAIANRLAKRALESIPIDIISQTFLSCGSKRLLTSFTRRLSYLHDCKPVIEIVNKWLNPDGWIGKEVNNLNDFGMGVFKNIAPVTPEMALEVIERAVSSSKGNQFTSINNEHHLEFVRLLRHLSYEPELFKRSVKIICRYALSEELNENRNSTLDILKPLFDIKLAGTHSKIVDRNEIIKELVGSEESNEQELGIFLLSTTLNANNFISTYEFAFGARSRDYGHKLSSNEVTQWYENFIGICTSIATLTQPVAKMARKILSDNLGGLWINAKMFQALEDAAIQIHKQCAWNEGWIAVQEIIRYHRNVLKEDSFKKLFKLENDLKPYDLLNKARTFALSDQHNTFNLDGDYEIDELTSGERAEETTRKIGSQVVQDSSILYALLPELVSTQSHRLFSFGKGLADGCSDKQKLWQIMREELEKTSSEKQQPAIFLGFLSSCEASEPSFFNSTLDNLITDGLFGKWFPFFQIKLTLDERGVERLHEALDIENAHIYIYQHLAWGRAHECLSDDNLAELLKKIISKENGIVVAIEILKMRFHRSIKETFEYSVNLIAVACEVLSTYSFQDKRNKQNNLDWDLAQITRTCLIGQEGIKSAKEICQHLTKAITDYHMYSYYPELLNSLAHMQPTVFLDEYLGNSDIEDYQGTWRFFTDDFEAYNNPLNKISVDNIISWCDDRPELRYPLVAFTTPTISKSVETNCLEWKPIVYAIFDKAPDIDVILLHLADSILLLRSWSGSRADILQNRSVLFENLYQHSNNKVSNWARTQFKILQEKIRIEREQERNETRTRDESFE